MGRQRTVVTIAAEVGAVLRETSVTVFVRFEHVLLFDREGLQKFGARVGDFLHAVGAGGETFGTALKPILHVDRRLDVAGSFGKAGHARVDIGLPEGLLRIGEREHFAEAFIAGGRPVRCRKAAFHAGRNVRTAARTVGRRRKGETSHRHRAEGGNRSQNLLRLRHLGSLYGSEGTASFPMASLYGMPAAKCLSDFVRT